MDEKIKKRWKATSLYSLCLGVYSKWTWQSIFGAQFWIQWILILELVQLWKLAVMVQINLITLLMQQHMTECNC